MADAARIKVAFFVPDLRAGGAERVVSILLEHLDRAEFDLELVSAFELSAAYDVPEDVRRVLLAEVEPADAAEPPVTLPASASAEDADALAWLNGMARRLVAYARDSRPDVLLSTPLWSSVIVGLALGDLPAETRWVHREAEVASVGIANDPNRDVLDAVFRARIGDADRVVAVSQPSVDDLVATYGVDPCRLELIWNSVDNAAVVACAAEAPDADLPDAEAPSVLFVGRLERAKNVELLLRAMTLVTATSPARLVVCGTGSQEGYLRALAKHLGIADRVTWAGYQSNPFAFMARADVFVLSSVTEGMPNVLLEAMACGCPVVTTDIPGSEILGADEYGLVVPRGDAEALAAAIQRVLGDDALRERLGERARARARELDRATGIARYIGALREVASAPVAERPAPAIVPEPVAEPESEPARPHGLAARVARAFSGLGRRRDAVADAPTDARPHSDAPAPTSPSAAATSAADAPSDADHPWLGEPTPVVVVLADGPDDPGVSVALDALSAVNAQLAVRGLLVGPGWDAESRDRIRAQAAGGQVDAIEARGLSRTALRSAFAVLDSSPEPSGTVPPAIAEAMAEGVPVISANRGPAVAEALSGGRGLVVARRDARPIAEAILQLVWDEDARVGMIRRATDYELARRDLGIPDSDRADSKEDTHT